MDAGTNIGSPNVATRTDYDARRRNAVEDAHRESLDAFATARKDAQSPDIDLDEGDTAEGVELAGADLSGRN